MFMIVTGDRYFDCARLCSCEYKHYGTYRGARSLGSTAPNSQQREPGFGVIAPWLKLPEEVELVSK